MGVGVFGNNQDAGCIFVQAVNNAGANLAADTRKIRTMVEQGVDEGAGGMTWRRMYHHPRGFVQNDQGVILINDIERNGFRLDIDSLRLRYSCKDFVARANPVARLCFALEEGDPSSADQLGGIGARASRNNRRQKGIEPKAGGLVIGDDPELVSNINHRGRMRRRQEIKRDSISVRIVCSSVSLAVESSLTSNTWAVS